MQIENHQAHTSVLPFVLYPPKKKTQFAVDGLKMMMRMLAAMQQA